MFHAVCHTCDAFEEVVADRIRAKYETIQHRADTGHDAEYREVC